MDPYSWIGIWIRLVGVVGKSFSRRMQSLLLQDYLGDLPRLMIASQKGHVRRIPSLEQHEQCEDLQAVVPPVHKVTHENVICAGHLSPSLQQLQ